MKRIMMLRAVFFSTAPPTRLLYLRKYQASEATVMEISEPNTGGCDICWLAPLRGFRIGRGLCIHSSFISRIRLILRVFSMKLDSANQLDMSAPQCICRRHPVISVIGRYTSNNYIVFYFKLYIIRLLYPPKSGISHQDSPTGDLVPSDYSLFRRYFTHCLRFGLNGYAD